MLYYYNYSGAYRYARALIGRVLRHILPEYYIPKHQFSKWPRTSS